MTSLFDDLTWRQLITDSTDPEALRTALDGEGISFYVGFDPSAASLHVGNLLQLITARRLQDRGHKPYLLVGGSTGLIGDPRQTSERNLNPKDIVDGWVERIGGQVERFLDHEGAASAVLVNNYEWTKDISALDFLRDYGKHFSVGRMLARDVVKRRLEAGISYTEFSYVILQSLDFVELHRRYGVRLQHGGSDQWGNISSGAELVRKMVGERVHGFTTPLITKADGTKYGKSEEGPIWLDPEMTSPYSFHQFFLNAEDSMVISYLKAFTRRDPDEIAELERSTAESPHLRAAQRALADDLTDLVHSETERRAATDAAAALFGQGELQRLPAATLDAVARELHAATVPSLDGVTVVDILVAAGVVASKSAARRAIAEGGASLNNVRLTSPDAPVEAADLLPGGHLVARRGKKTVGMVTLGTAS
ncbi:MAG: tyrosine--tRNA ligase [Propionibacteriaceae bacterium]|jgi:tyrosyl-tRNA synthetase|nr:tyrosine--tRNA ligase [Propionibacteriaceae bacterium]